MKKSILTLMLIVLAFVASAQTKKVAVMETKAAAGVTEFQSNMVRGGMEEAVAHADDYEGYDRASFDKIMEEHNFQRSGAVDDAQIKELGQMAGVQYVLVTEASTDGNGFFITAKMLDVETGLMENVVNTYCNATAGKDIYEASVRLGQQLVGTEVASYERPAAPFRPERPRMKPHEHPRMNDTSAVVAVEPRPVEKPCMEAADFDKALKLVKDENFDDNRLSLAKRIASTNALSVQQIIEICKLFSFESNKLDFAKHAYSTCCDKQSYYLLNEVFSFSSSKKELDRYISEQ